jgi:acyl-CoA reductase-like NAD-dependent aldehyde dehydrogenase
VEAEQLQTAFDQQEIAAVVERVRSKLRGRGEASPPSRVEDHEPVGDGIYPDVDAAVAAARSAFEAYRSMGLKGRHRIIDAVRTAMRDRAEELARMAHEETGLGRTEDKILKNRLVIEKTPGPEDLEPRVWSGDQGLTVTEYAPFGVIGAITPTTNPTATIINNTIAIVSAGNAVVFNAHPAAKKVSVQNIRWINQAIVAAGGPPDLVTATPEPTIDSAQRLMNHPRVRILMITGGPGVVKEAQKTRKRSICAGPGNPPVVVDANADLELAGREIVRGASFDNNVICTDEKVVIAVDTATDELLRQMQRNNAYLLKAYELKKLERVIFREMGEPGEPGRVNPRWIGQNAGTILGEIGIQAGSDLRLVLADVPAEHSLVWTEQMMPVMPVVRVRTVDDAIDLAIRAEHGCGHTASIYSRDVNAITRMARDIDVSIFVANAANLAGLGDGGEGYTSFSIASPTGEGLTRPRSFSRDRRMTVAGGLRIV